MEIAGRVVDLTKKFDKIASEFRCKSLEELEDRLKKVGRGYVGIYQWQLPTKEPK